MGCGHVAHSSGLSGAQSSYPSSFFRWLESGCPHLASELQRAQVIRRYLPSRLELVRPGLGECCRPGGPVDEARWGGLHTGYSENGISSGLVKWDG